MSDPFVAGLSDHSDAPLVMTVCLGIESIVMRTSTVLMLSEQT